VLIDDGGLADIKISGNERQRRRATGYHLVQLASRTELACSPVHLIHPVKKSRQQDGRVSLGVLSARIECHQQRVLKRSLSDGESPDVKESFPTKLT